MNIIQGETIKLVYEVKKNFIAKFHSISYLLTNLRL